MNKFLLFVVAGLFLLQGCKTQRLVVKNEYPNPTYRQLLEWHERWQKSIVSFSAEGLITVETPQFSGKFEADIYAKGKDSLLVAVSGFMGANVAKVFVGKERFIFYNQYDNQFITGRKEDFSGTQFLQFPVSVSMLRDLVLAQDHFTILKKEKFERRPGGYYLQAQNGHYDYQIWFDKKTMLISKINYVKDGETVFRKEYKKFAVYDGFYFPRVINFVRPSEKQGMSIIFKKIAINREIPSSVFKVKVGDNARQVLLPGER